MIVLVSCLLLWTAIVRGCDQNGPLGMITGEIQDWQITASSSYPQEWDKGCHEKFARIYQPNGLGWCAKYKSSSEWLQVDLGVSAKVTGVMTQGRGDGVEWVTAFMVSYSVDGISWKYIEDNYGNQRLFEGNFDAYSVKHSYLDKPITARLLKFHTVHWNRHPSMRVEIIGCQRCKQMLAMPPYGKLTASSSHPFRKRSSCQPEDGHILSNKGWCSRREDDGQWLQYDIGPSTTITGLVTKGRGDTGRKNWVTRFRISYSNDSRVWYYYKEDQQQQSKNQWYSSSGSNLSYPYASLPDKYSPDGMIFGGNVDKHMDRYHYLGNPIIARYVRFHPLEWEKAISMRAGVIGCPHTGECGPGFIRVNEDSPCVENLAFRKATWINNQRHSKRHTRPKWMQAHAARAVDGVMDNQLHSCTILDNFNVDKPVWMVDVGFKTEISGVIIVTWQGEGQDTSQTYRDYMYNLDKLAVYIDSKANVDNVDQSELCGYVSRRNNALFHPKLHIPCNKPIKGRYVYIEAWGVPDTRLFSAVLCEVMVYS